MTSDKKNLVRRWLLLLVGLTIMAFGVAFSIKASLGTSPISSVPYVISLFSPLTVGVATICMHVVFILMQILILRKNFEWIQLLQLPVAFVFGFLIDLAMWVLAGLSPSGYLQQWGLCILGILLVGIGVDFEVSAKVVTLAGEGLVLALCQVLPIRFPAMKITFDVSLVALAVVLSLIFTGHIAGIREGTVAAAVFVGLTAKAAHRLIHRAPAADPGA